MGDQNEGRAALRLCREKQVGDMRAGCRVEIAGRLVGKDDGRAGGKRSGDGDTLLLAAGELRRIVVEAVGEPDRAEFLTRPRESVCRPGEFERDGDIFERGHVRDEVEGLENDADRASAEPREGILVEGNDVGAVDDDAPRLRPLQAGEDHEQRRFSAARGANQAEGLSAIDGKADFLEDMNLART